MRTHFRFLCLSLAMLCIGAVSRAQLTGAITVPSTTYPTLASVITALNTQGVGAGGATITLSAGNPETAPTGGYQLGSATLNASLSSANPLVINGSGNTLTGQTGVGSNDGIFWLMGVDYVTINSFNLVDVSTTTASSSTTANEWGFVLAKRSTTSPYDGCQRNLINNCSISLNKYVSTATGILVAHIHPSSTGPSTASFAVGDANSFNKFTGNTITNVSRGFFLGGSSAGIGFYDKANEVGGTTAASGNTITIGGTTLANTLYGVITQYDSVVTVQRNKVYIGSGQTNTTFYGYYAGIGVGTLNILNNYVNMACNNSSSSAYGIYNSSAHSDLGCTHNINGNEITGNNAATTNTSTFYGIYDYFANCAQLNINGNNLHDINWGSAGTSYSGDFYGIYTYYNTISSGLSISNNIEYNLSRIGTYYYFYPTYCYQYNSTGGTFYIENNTFRKLITTAYYPYMNYNMAGYPASNRMYYRYNTIDSLDMRLRTEYAYVYNYMTYYSGDSSQCSYNTLTNWLGPNTTSTNAYTYYYTYAYQYYGQKGSRASGNLFSNWYDNYGYYYNYLGYYGQFCDSNTISKVYMGHLGGPNGGLYNYLGYYGSTGFSRNNLVRDVFSNGQTCANYFGYYGDNYTVSGNRVSNIDLGGSGSVQNFMGYYATGAKVFNNRVDSLATNTGTLYGIYSYAYGANDTLYNNVVSNLRVKTGTTNTVYGYYLGGNVATAQQIFYNNALSNIETPSTFNGSALYGVYTAGTLGYKLFNNTIRISPTTPSSGTNFGATGIYYSTSGTLDLRNNIIYVNVTPGSGATAVALRRSGGTPGTPPANFLGTSNSNIYYTPNVTNAYLYGESTSTTMVNGYNLSNDPNFNTPCGLFKTFVGHDAASFTENNLVPSGTVANAYVPSTSIASYAEKGGTATTNPTVGSDLAGVTRGTPSDIGALEFSGIALDNAPPQISYTPVPTPSYCTTAPQIIATITDQTGVDTNRYTSPPRAPRLYYKFTTNTNTFGGNTSGNNGWKYVQPTTISGNQFVFDMDYNLLTSTPTAGNCIEYFIIAQDITSSTYTTATYGTFAVCPTSVNLTAANAPTNAAPALNSFCILTASSFTASAALNKMCVSGSTVLSLNPNPLGTALQWQSAPIGSSTFTNIPGATTASYQTPVLTSSIQYRAQLFCGTSVLTTTAPVTITVNNPAITSTTSGIRCGYGPVTLSAATNAGTNVNWYTSATSTNPIATGTSFTTPNLSSSVTYYAAAVVPGGATEVLTGPIPTTYYSGLNPTYGYGLDFHFSDSVTWYSTMVFVTASGNLALQLTDLATGNVVKTFGPVAVTGTASLNSPYTANLNWVIPPGDYRLQVDPSNTASLHYSYNGSQFPYPYYSSVTGRAWISNGYYPGIGVYNYYYWFAYNNIISGPCQNPTRYPVTATVNPSTPITASSPNSPGICSGSSATLNVSSTNGSYLYYWYANTLPVPLSTTATGVINGASITVSPTATTKYYVIGRDVLTGCQAIDSITISVNPQQCAPSISPTNPTICQNSNVQLTATPCTPFGGVGTIGTGTTTVGNYYWPTPFQSYYPADHQQYLVRASELTAQGVPAGPITQLGFYVNGSYPGPGVQNYIIKIAPTTATALTAGSFINSGFQKVYDGGVGSNYVPGVANGWNIMPFGTQTGTSTFIWDGTSNIVVDLTMTRCNTCNATPAVNCTSASYYSSADTRMTTTSFNSVLATVYPTYDCSIPTFSPSTTPSVFTTRPNMQFYWKKPYSINWTNVTGLYKTFPPLAGPLTLTDTVTKVYAAPQTTQVYRAVTNAVGCLSSLSAPDTVFVNPAPPTTITPAGPQAICSGNSVTLCAPSGTTMTYQWLLNNAIIAGATSNCYIASSAGSYRVRVVNLTTGCFDTSIATVVTVNALPTASISTTGTTTFCNGGSVVLGPVVTNAAPAVYQWYNNGTAIPGATGTTYTATTSGNYTVVVTNSNQCSQTSNPIAVTVNTVPNTVTPSGSTTFCTGGSVTLTAPTTGTGAPFTYQWYNGTTAISGATSSTYSATTSGNYSVVITSTTLTPNCSSTSTQTAVVVGSAPSSAIVPAGPQNLCSGDALLLTTNTAPGLVYQWYNGTTAISGATNATYSATTAGSYTVNVAIATQTSCNSTTATPTVITVNPKPTVTASASGSTTVCMGGGVNLTGASTGTAAATSWQWKLNGSPVATGGTSNTYTATQSGSYTVTGTNSFGCSNTSAPIVVTVNPLPAVAITQSGPSNICQGGSVTLTSNPATFNTYQWKIGGVNAPGVSNTSSYTVSNTGNYTVTVTDANGCTNTSTPVGILVNPLPSATTSPTGTVNICSGSNVTITTPTIANTTVQWGNPLAIPGATQRSYTTGTAGSYAVTVTNTVTGCQATSAAVVVTVSAPPTATATRAGLSTICAGDSSRINANTGTNLTYQWNYNGAPIAGATGVSYYAKNQGTYTVTVANGSCTATSTGVSITVNPAPAAFITYNTPVTFCEGSAVALNANSGTGLTYLWIMDNVPTTNTSNNYVASVSGVYQLKTVNGFGCAGYSDTLRVTVNPVPHPVLTRAGNTLGTTQTYLSYQWFLNNSGIGGATNPTYTFTQNGAYKVRVMDSNGCEGYSEIMFIQNVGITPTALSAAIKVFPNPTTGLLHIDAPVKVKLALRDVTGKVVAEAAGVKEMDITTVANGMYLLYISDMNGKLLRADKVTKTAE